MSHDYSNQLRWTVTPLLLGKLLYQDRTNCNFSNLSQVEVWRSHQYGQYGSVNEIIKD
ncbi:MAG: hypothetical protein V7K98_13520 [Nostoc sp.]|uniref:hypothetical protein n=1 Tax=Nostoc sp. TaxID=1180 RepID=UPI002FF734EE